MVARRVSASNTPGIQTERPARAEFFELRATLIIAEPASINY